MTSQEEALPSGSRGIWCVLSIQSPPDKLSRPVWTPLYHQEGLGWDSLGWVVWERTHPTSNQDKRLVRARGLAGWIWVPIDPCRKSYRYSIMDRRLSQRRIHSPTGGSWEGVVDGPIHQVPYFWIRLSKYAGFGDRSQPPVTRWCPRVTWSGRVEHDLTSL
jgi:hypothetical protein